VLAGFDPSWLDLKSVVAGFGLSANGLPNRYPKDHQPAAPNNGSPTTHNDGGHEFKTFGELHDL
jgi:hypothetical protein